jgi:hypothetical protein
MISWPFWVLLGVVSLAIIGVYLSHMAGRLDRLHLKIQNNRTSLQKSLLTRANRAQSVARDYPATCQPATQVIQIADECLRPDDQSRESWFVESRLTAALLNLSAQPATSNSLADWERLVAAARKVALARTFYNDTTRMCRNLRKRRIVRWFKLAGYAAYPQPINFDDRVPHLPKVG